MKAKQEERHREGGTCENEIDKGEIDRQRERERERVRERERGRERERERARESETGKQIMRRSD